jgi:hypothetical protein
MVFVNPDVGPTILVLGHEDVKCGFGASLWLALFILLALAILWTFCLNHPWRSFLSYDNLLALGRLDLRCLNQDHLSIDLDHVHIRRVRFLVELHLGTFCKFQSSFVYGSLNLSMENIAIVTSMRIRIMPFIINKLFELFQ